MKKHIIGILAASLLLTSVAFLTKKEETPAEAIDPNYHLFVQVESENDLKVGDKIFLSTLGGTQFACLSGNPVFASECHISGRSEDGKKYYTRYTSDYQDMILMEVETGAYADTYSFRSIRSKSQEKDYAHPTHGRYLAYGHEYSDEKYHGIQAYGDVNMADGKNANTSWTVEFRGEDKYAILKRYGEEYDTHIQWVYYGRTARNNFGYYTGNTDIAIFKEIDVTQDSGRVELNIFRHQDQTTVYEGDYLDLTGLEITVIIDKGTLDQYSFVSSYDNEPGFYSISPAAKDPNYEYSHIYITYANWNFNLEVKVIEDTSGYEYFNEVKTQKGDYRGSYMIVQQSGVDLKVFRRDGIVMDYTKENEDDPMCSSVGNITQHIFNLFRKRINGVSYMFFQSNHSGRYLIRSGADDFDFTYDVDDLTVNDAITIDENLNVHIGDGILYCDSVFYIGSNPSMDKRAKLYKHMVDYTSTGSNFDTFISDFASVTSAGCDASGEDDTTITTSEWNTLGNKFNDIANDMCGYDFQGYLANMTYVHNQGKGSNSIKDLIDRYDFILSKYQSLKGFDDFMDRIGNPAYQDNYGKLNDPILEDIYLSNNNIPIILIVVISVTSVIALSTLLVIKRRKRR